MGRLSKKDIDILSLNPYVEKVDERQIQITYSEDFKRRFIKEYTAGKSSKEIFSDAGFDIEMIGYKRIEGATRRWRENRKLTGYGRGEFTEEEIKVLKNNDFVVSVNSKRIIYSEKFKEFFVENYKKGYTPTEIFRMAKFDIRMIGTKRIERAAARWKRKYIEDGSLCKSK